MLLQLPSSDRTLANQCIPTHAVCRYTITVYQCKYDTPVVGSTYTWNTLTHGLDDTNEECIRIADNYYAILAKDETTIASTNGKTSITYGCDAHRAQSPDGAHPSAPAPLRLIRHASVAP